MQKKFLIISLSAIFVLMLAVSVLAQDKGLVVNRSESSTYYNPPKTLLVTPLMTKENAPAANIYLGLVTIKSGAVVPLHDHGETYEILYVQSGGATVTIGDKKYKVTAGSIVYFPANVKHSLVNDTDMDLVGIQIYAPPGNPTADARFFKWPKLEK
jgi:quercetin dioxygenase-like cupin family protein